MDRMYLGNVGKQWLKGHVEFSLHWLYPHGETFISIQFVVGVEDCQISQVREQL